MTESKGPSTWASAKMLDLGPPPQILHHVPCPQGSQLAKGVDPLTRMAARPRPLHTPTQLSSAAGGFAVTTGSPPQHPFTPLLVKQDSAFPWREPALQPLFSGLMFQVGPNLRVEQAANGHSAPPRTQFQTQGWAWPNQSQQLAEGYRTRNAE